MKKQQSAARQPQYNSVHLYEFFKNIPGLADVFNKGTTGPNQPKYNCTTCDESDCTACQLTDAIGALSTCGKTFERVGTLVELVRDLAADGGNTQRVLVLCQEIHNVIADGQTAIDGAGLE
jgi:hypothetical protein